MTHQTCLALLVNLITHWPVIVVNRGSVKSCALQRWPSVSCHAFIHSFIFIRHRNTQSLIHTYWKFTAAGSPNGMFSGWDVGGNWRYLWEKNPEQHAQKCPADSNQSSGSNQGPSVLTFTQYSVWIFFRQRKQNDKTCVSLRWLSVLGHVFT